MMSGENVKYSVSTSMMPVIESDNFLRAFFNKRLLQRDSFDILTDMPSKVF